MFGIVIGVLAVGVVAWEVLRPRTVSPADIERMAREQRARLALAASAGSQYGIDPKVALRCGLIYSDFTAADAWSITYLGANLPLRQRLEAMRSMVPPDAWPLPAQRVYCALHGTV